MRKLFVALLLPLLTMLATGPVSAAEYGTAEEAKMMLEKAVAALKADKAKALAMFVSGEGGFKDRDLYPYCGGPDGMFTAHPTLTGKDLKSLQDKAGKPIGVELYARAKDGEIAEIDYVWPRPGDTTPVGKVAYFTKVGDQICAVGYYQ